MEHAGRIPAAILTASLSAFSAMAAADCPGTAIRTDHHCLYLGDFSSLSSALDSGGQHPIAAVNMFPFEQQPTEEGLHEDYQKATALLDAGIASRNALVSITYPEEGGETPFIADFDCPAPDPETGAMEFVPLCNGVLEPHECYSFREILLCDPEANYETPLKFVKTDDPDHEGAPDVCDLSGSGAGIAGLERARDVFAYQAALGWEPGGGNASPRIQMLKSIRAIADVYLAVADEFFIDGAEFRVAFTDAWKLDQKLDAQIALMTKARLCYQGAVDAFVSGFSPSVGTNLYASDLFGEADTEDGNLYSLFNLAVERWASAWREETSKRRARVLSFSDADTAVANAAFDMSIRDAAIQTYLLAAANAATDPGFPANGGPRLELALNLIRDLAMARSAGLNPLGYDDRFVPLRDFSPGLFEDARTMQANAEQSFLDFQAYRREEDTNLDRLMDLMDENNITAIRAQLATLTGIPLSLYDTAPGEFNADVRVAGDNFDECSLELDNDPFVACMNGADKARGYLAAKYYDMHRARQQWRLADRQKTNLLEEIASENRRYGEALKIEHRYWQNFNDTLDNFLEAMKKARTVQVSEEKFESKKQEEWEGEEETDDDESDVEGERTTEASGRSRTTTTTYYLSNPALENDITKEKDLQAALTEYRISLNDVEHASNIGSLLRRVAEQEIQLGLAIQAENAAALDFGNLIGQRDDLLFQLDQAMAMLEWQAPRVMARSAEARVLKSRAGLQFETDFNQAVRFAYLAAKTLEYKYMRPLVDIPVGGADNLLNISDLFKIQDVVELDRFIDKLDLYDACPWGSIQFAPIELSLVWDILGYNDAYLETQAGGALTDQELEEERERLWRGYVARNLERDPETGRSLLRIRFSTSLTDPAIDWAGLYNAKIWWGVAPSPCDPVPTNGVAVNFDSSQPGTRWKPRVIIEQSGSNTFLTPEEEIVEYTPVGLYLNMTGENTDNMFRSRALLSDSRTGLFIGEEPNPAVAWSNGLKGRGIASPNWTLEVKDVGREPIQWDRLHDIVLYFDVIGATQ